jgi:hypothetical protein
MTEEERKAIIDAVQDVYSYSGCGCCGDLVAVDAALDRLAELLGCKTEDFEI